MREIKFRIWDINARKWLKSFNIDLLDIPKFNLAEVNQYIGLKDKNNKEIYEGDIVTLHNGKYKVIFNTEEARFVLRDDEFEMNIPFTNNNNKRMEVIGNIYENPELIKEVR